MAKYITQLTEEQIIKFFESINILPFLTTDRNGDFVSPIIDCGDFKIFKGVVDLNEEEKDVLRVQEMLFDKLSIPKKRLGFSKFTENKKTVLIELTDYFAYIFDEEKVSELDKIIYKNYIKFMKETFESYEADYNVYVSDNYDDNNNNNSNNNTELER